MIIANPIYDVVFKRLMENERVAKFFISTLLGETVVDLAIKAQERTILPKVEDMDEQALASLEKQLYERLSISVFRVDFVATVKTDEGEYKKVLIEIQKAKNALDLMRFRTYLAEHYKTEDKVEIDGKKTQTALPIVTIYMLGFEIAEIEAVAIKIKRDYWDLINQQILETKSAFVEALTHDSYVVQIPRIQGNTRTRLEQMLSVFEQKYFVTEKGILKNYIFPVENEVVKEMLSILVFVAADEKLRKAIEDEQEAYRLLEVISENRRKELEKIIKEKDEQLVKKDEQLVKKDQQLVQKDQQLESERKKNKAERARLKAEKEATTQALEAERKKNEALLQKLQQAGLL